MTGSNANISLSNNQVGGSVIAATPLVAYQGLNVTDGTLKPAITPQFPNYAYAALPGTGMMVFDDGHANWVSMAGTLAAR